MIKIKTIKSIIKRIKITSLKKIKFKRSNTRHILTKKNKNYKRKLKKKKIINNKNNKKIKKCIPYI